jgi:hypothetical protein
VNTNDIVYQLAYYVVEKIFSCKKSALLHLVTHYHNLKTLDHNWFGCSEGDGKEWSTFVHGELRMI